MYLWSITEAQEFCSKLHDHLIQFGYDVGLAGGVLVRGWSDKDIDIIIYPLKKLSSDYDRMYRSLPGFGLVYVRLPYYNLGHPDDGKNVQVFEFEGKRVDLLFLS